MVRLQGNNQSGEAGQMLPLALVARAADECGNAVARGAAELGSASAGRGNARKRLYPDQRQRGGIRARVRIGNAPRTLCGARRAAAARRWRFQPDGYRDGEPRRRHQRRQPVHSRPAQAAPQPLVVELQDAGGNPLANTQVDFRITQGSGGLAGASAVTDASGRASTTVTAGPQVGSLQVEARSGDGVFVFTLTVIGRTPAGPRTAGFVNGASFVSGWTPGSTGSIFGVGLMEGVDGVVLPPAPFPTTLRGVQVLVENTPAPILSMANINGQEQINIQVPFGVPAPGEALVTIINNGASATFPGVPTLAAQPAVFEVTLPGGRFAAALHADFSLVDPDHPARPGEVLQLFWTGGGATNPAVATDQPGPVPPAEVVAAVTVSVNGTNADVLGSFYAPTLVTVYQTNFRVPAGASGTSLIVQLAVNGAQSQKVTIPFAP